MSSVTLFILRYLMSNVTLFVFPHLMTAAAITTRASRPEEVTQKMIKSALAQRMHCCSDVLRVRGIMTV